MWRKMVGYAVVGLMMCAGAAMAADVKGDITKVDVDGKKVTVKGSDGKEVDYAVAADCKMYKYGKEGKDQKTATLETMKSYVEKNKDNGVEINMVTTKKDDKEMVTEIKSVHSKKKDKKGKA